MLTGMAHYHNKWQGEREWSALKGWVFVQVSKNDRLQFHYLTCSFAVTVLFLELIHVWIRGSGATALTGKTRPNAESSLRNWESHSLSRTSPTSLEAEDVHNSQSLILFINEMNPVHTLASHFLKDLTTFFNLVWQYKISRKFLNRIVPQIRNAFNMKCSREEAN